MITVDLAIVGAGIVGAAIAEECSRRGARVALVDAGVPGAASPVAAGMLAPASEADAPGPFLDLARRSLALWPTLAARLAEAGAACGLVLDGLVRPALDEADAQRCHAAVGWQRAAGIAVEWLDAAAVREIEPALGPVVGGAWYPQEGHVPAARAVAALRAVASARGALTIGARVVGWQSPGALRLDGAEPLTAPVVVVAGGAWTSSILDALGAPQMDVRPVRGQLVHLALDALRPRRVVYAGRLGYVLARRDGTVVVGATSEEAGFTATPSPEATRRLLDQAARLVPTLVAGRVVATPVGLRPATADGLPVVGELEAPAQAGTTRLVVATGHFRNGVLLAPITATAVADLALEGRLGAEWAPFGPERAVAGRAPTTAER